MRFIYIILILLTLIPKIYSQPATTEETMAFQLRWQEVTGATGYLLEIKNSSGYMVISEKMNSNVYDVVNFTSGKYEHRVGVINKFGKVGSFSDWVPFEVVVSRIPTLTKESVFAISKEEKTKTFELIGKDFIDPMKVFLVLDGRTISAKKVEIESSTKAKAVFEIPPELDTGIYDLVLENPRKKTLNVKQRVVISDSKEKANRFANRQERILKKEIPEDYYESPYWSTLWRSAVIPGWGQQYIDGQNWKVYVYPLIAAGIVGAYAQSYNRFQSSKSAYDDSVLIGFLLSENPDLQIPWLLNRNTAMSNFDTAKQELNLIQGGAGLFGAFLLYNLVDSYLSARRNVAQLDPLPGFKLGQENIRLNAKVDALPQYGLREQNQRQIDSFYLLEFSFRY